MVILALNFLSCGGQKNGVTASGAGGGAPGPKDPDKKPDPDADDRTEKFKQISFQAPTQVVADYENVLTLDLTKSSQAWFSFLYSPEKDGVFYFTRAQVGLSAKCAGFFAKAYSYRVFWQEVTDKKRTVLKEFKHSILPFEYKAGKYYVLTYSLTDLKKDFADCETATLKFAVFQQDY